MSRGGFKITRCSEELPTEGKRESVPNWMKRFAENADKYVESDEKTAVTVVDKGRERQQSVYQQMYSIMNGKPPLYSSVEEAVSDYHKKTGLTEHVRRAQAETIKSAALYILASGAEGDVMGGGVNYSPTGITGGEETGALESGFANDKKSKSDDEDEDEDEDEGESKKGPDDPENLKEFLEMLKEDEDEDVLVISIDDVDSDVKEIKEGNPDIFSICPDFDGFANNLVSSNPKLSIPALLERISSTFDGEKSSYFEDPKLMNYLAKMLSKYDQPEHKNYALMGKDLDTDSVEGAEDPFFVLRPDNNI